MKPTPKHLTITEVREAATAGLAFAQAMGPVIPQLKRRALALTGKESEACDLLQSTLERAWKHFGALSRYDNVSGWALIVMRGLFVDEYRRSRLRPTSALDDCIDFSAPAGEQKPLWACFTVEDVTKALPALSVALREPFYLHEFEGLSYREIASRLDIPPATVGTRIMRARWQVRSLLLDNQRRSAPESFVANV